MKYVALQELWWEDIGITERSHRIELLGTELIELCYRYQKLMKSKIPK